MKQRLTKNKDKYFLIILKYIQYECVLNSASKGFRCFRIFHTLIVKTSLENRVLSIINASPVFFLSLVSSSILPMCCQYIINYRQVGMCTHRDL